MIIEWLIDIGAAIATWAASIFPEWVVPDALLHVDDQVNGFFANLSGFSPWVDWGFVGIVAAIPISVWGIGLMVKLSRAAIAHLPFIGGKG